MGFSTIGSFIMMFFGFLIVATTLVLIYSSTIQSANDAYSMQKELLLDKAMTSISLSFISFDNTTSPDRIKLNITNNGKTKLYPGYIELYIDDIKIPRSSTNRSLELSSSSINPMLFDPGESIIATIYLDLWQGQHIATASTENGIEATALFSVP